MKVKLKKNFLNFNTFQERKMNERIKELAEQATQLMLGRPDLDIEYVMEKFGKLIVKECTNAIINDSRLNDVRSAANGCVRTINEHFGVE